MRSIGFFVLGFVLAYAIYLSGGLNWLHDYLASRPPDYATAVIPPPPPLSSPTPGIVTQTPTPPSYPTTEPGCTNGQTPPGCVIGPADQAGTVTYTDSGQTDEGTQDVENDGQGASDDEDEQPPSTSTDDTDTDQDDQAAPPAPAITSPPDTDHRHHRRLLKVRLSDGEQYGVAPGCSPAFTVINETRRPILVSTGRHHHHRHWRRDRDREDWQDRREALGDRGRHDGKVLLPPGEREVVCVDESHRRHHHLGFDYYSPYPDADVPPEEDEYVARTVNIRLKDR